jgi:RNA polymerase sigma-70 factor (ECF subfamily)
MFRDVLEFADVSMSSQGRSVDDAQVEDLVARAVTGDRDALTDLLEHNAVSLRGLLSRKIATRWRSSLDVDDVLQVTFLEAFLRIGRFDSRGGGAFEAWLVRIAENNLIDAVRSLERAKRLPPEKRITPPNEADSSLSLLDRVGATTGTPSRHVAMHEAHAAVQQAIDGLPEDYARVLSLYDLQGMTADSVAEVMKRSVGAIYMLRARALDRLRETLGRQSRFFSDKS